MLEEIEETLFRTSYTMDSELKRGKNLFQNWSELETHSLHNWTNPIVKAERKTSDTELKTCKDESKRTDWELNTHSSQMMKYVNFKGKIMFTKEYLSTQQ